MTSWNPATDIQIQSGLISNTFTKKKRDVATLNSESIYRGVLSKPTDYDIMAGDIVFENLTSAPSMTMEQYPTVMSQLNQIFLNNNLTPDEKQKLLKKSIRYIGIALSSVHFDPAMPHMANDLAAGISMLITMHNTGTGEYGASGKIYPGDLICARVPRIARCVSQCPTNTPNLFSNDVRKMETMPNSGFIEDTNHIEFCEFMQADEMIKIVRMLTMDVISVALNRLRVPPPTDVEFDQLFRDMFTLQFFLANPSIVQEWEDSVCTTMSFVSAIYVQDIAARIVGIALTTAKINERFDVEVIPTASNLSVYEMIDRFLK